MPDAVNSITLTAALLAGIAGSAHCFTMCGGLASALGMHARATTATAAAAFRTACVYQVGRLSGYAIAGALCGAFGAAVQRVLDLSRLAATLRVASGVLLILVAARVLFSWNALRWLERFGARFWLKLQPLVRRTKSMNGTTHALILGALWGWLPCGLVYSMLLFAAFSGHALHGAAIMLAFGFGTLPSMLTGTALASQLHRLLARRWPRVVSGTLLMMFGIWMTVAALYPMEHAHHHALLATSSGSAGN